MFVVSPFKDILSHFLCFSTKESILRGMALRGISEAPRRAVPHRIIHGINLPTCLSIGKRRLGLLLSSSRPRRFLAAAFGSVGAAAGNVPKNVVVRGVANMGTPSSTNADFNTFWEAWATIHDNYLRDGSTTDQDRVYGAISGLVGSLNDPYSEFFTPEGNQQFQQDITAILAASAHSLARTRAATS